MAQPVPRLSLLETEQATAHRLSAGLSAHTVTVFSLHTNRNKSNSNCSEEWLQHIASQSDMSYVFEDVLRAKLQQPACTLSRGAVASLDSVLFVVLCSKALQQRVAGMVDGWMHWVPRQNVMLLCGDDIPGLNVTLLPRLPIDTGVVDRFEKASVQGANLRHLRSMWWLVHIVPSVLQQFQWILYADDDTFVNVPRLLTFLHGIPSHLPLLITYLHRPPHSLDNPYRNMAFPSGGAGMLFTRPALQQLGSVLFLPLCEVIEPINDVSIARCTKVANVTKISSASFLPEAVLLNKTENWIDAGMAVTVHRIKERAQSLELTCLVAARYGWPHPQCTHH
jgi:hypothetical protein